MSDHTHDPPDSLPAIRAEVVTPDRIAQETTLQKAMIQPAVDALARPGAKVNMNRGKGEPRWHVTISCLTEMASYVGVSVFVDPPRQVDDPVTGEICASVSVRAVRTDGVTAEATGVASIGETQTRWVNGEQRVVRRWEDWHAVTSMAETRGKVRALTAMFSPIIQIASDGDVAVTPAEIMPDYGDYPDTDRPPKKAAKKAAKNPVAEAKHALIQRCGGDGDLAAWLWNESGGDQQQINELVEWLESMSEPF